MQPARYVAVGDEMLCILVPRIGFIFGPSPVRLLDLARIFVKRSCIDLRVRCAFHRQEFGMRPLKENVTGSFRVHRLNSLYSVKCPSDDLPVLRKCVYVTQSNHCGLSTRRSLKGGCKQTAFHLHPGSMCILTHLKPLQAQLYHASFGRDF